MADYTVTLTAAEDTAMAVVAASVQEWIDNDVKNRARVAINEIVKLYTARALDEGVTIPSTRDEIVADALARGWVITAQAANEAAEASADKA